MCCFSWCINHCILFIYEVVTFRCYSWLILKQVMDKGQNCNKRTHTHTQTNEQYKLENNPPLSLCPPWCLVAQLSFLHLPKLGWPCLNPLNSQSTVAYQPGNTTDAAIRRGATTRKLIEWRCPLWQIDCHISITVTLTSLSFPIRPGSVYMSNPMFWNTTTAQFYMEKHFEKHVFVF